MSNISNWRSKSNDLLLHAGGKFRKQRVPSRQNNISVQVLAIIKVALYDGVVCGFMNTHLFKTKQRRLEQRFSASEPLHANRNNLPQI